MFEIDKMPKLPGQNRGLEPQEVKVEDLSNIGINGGAFGIREGEIIEFPNEIHVVGQKISADKDANTAYYVGVLRDGKESYLSLGLLTRRDADGKPLGKFQQDMLAYPSAKEILESLKGKKIKGGSPVTHKFAVFVNGVRQNETRERAIPEINYV